MYAQFALGNCYATGKGVETDCAQAAEWYRRSSEQGCDVAQYCLGSLYYLGCGVEQNYVEAVVWIRIAAEQGEVQAQMRLGNCYSEGLGIKQDDAKASYWFRKAAEQGNMYAQFALGNCYATGKGVETDCAQAGLWYRRSAEQGYDIAQYCLGSLYYLGCGVEQNYVEAVVWIRKAAEQGEVQAQMRLGNCYIEGLGIKQDDVQASYWFRKAAEQGYVNAHVEAVSPHVKPTDARLSGESKRKPKTALIFMLLVAMGIAFAAKVVIDNRARAAYNIYIDYLGLLGDFSVQGVAYAQYQHDLTRLVWTNTLLAKSDPETNRYVAPKGVYVGDYRVALSNLNNDPFMKDIALGIELQREVIEAIWMEIQDVPVGLEECYEAASKLYDVYIGYAELALSPSGSLFSYSERMSSYYDDFIKYSVLLGEATPDKIPN